MELPEIITRLPEVQLPIPSTTVRTSLLQSEHGQLVLFQILKDVELPPHSHNGQRGTVLDPVLSPVPDHRTLVSKRTLRQRHSYGGLFDNLVGT